MHLNSAVNWWQTYKAKWKDCCDKATNPDKAAGFINCCDGVPYMCADLNNMQKAPPEVSRMGEKPTSQSAEAKKMLEQCIYAHELTHFNDIVCPDSGNGPSIWKPSLANNPLGKYEEEKKGAQALAECKESYDCKKDKNCENSRVWLDEYNDAWLSKFPKN